MMVMAERKEYIDKVFVTIGGSSLSLSLISSSWVENYFHFFFKQTFVRFHSSSKDILNSFFIIQIFILPHRVIVPKRRFYMYTDKIRFSTLSYAQEAHVQ